MTGTATIITAVIAFALTAVIGKFLIPFLQRVKFGQPINEIGPTWHKEKQGTPTMGGIMFIIGVAVAVCVGFIVIKASGGDEAVVDSPILTTRLFAGLGLALACAVIGFVDDYKKVMQKNNAGISRNQKMLFQLLAAVGYLLALYLAGDTTTAVMIPFTGWSLDLWLFYYPLAVIGIIGMVNSVNLTDGVDGLATSVTFVAAIAFMAVLLFMPEVNIWINLLATALAGGCLGFLIWNFHPAKCFMGDTGSMFLGGCICALAFGCGQPLLVVLIGIVYICESLSVIIQGISFKRTGKRIFKMSPIHHHFEMSGWSEEKIVIVFSLVALAGGALAVLSAALH